MGWSVLSRLKKHTCNRRWDKTDWHGCEIVSDSLHLDLDDARPHRRHTLVQDIIAIAIILYISFYILDELRARERINLLATKLRMFLGAPQTP